MKKLAVSAAVALLGLAQAVAAHGHHHHEHMDQDFKECLCWDSKTNEFCNGPEFYKSDACNKVFAHLTFIVPVLGIFAIALLLFPALFYLSRWCCRCCGGRYATRGCCCSDESSRVTFPGYTNCSIRFTRYTFVAVFLGTIAVSVPLFVHNARLHHSISKTRLAMENDADTSMGQLQYFTSQAEVNAVNPDLSSKASGFFSASYVKSLKAVYQVGQRYTGDLRNVLEHVWAHEAHGVVSRNVMTYLIPASGLGVLLAVLMCALTHSRKWVGILMVSFCIHAATMCIVNAPQSVVANTLSVGCHNYDDVVMPIVKGQAEIHGLCNVKEIADGVEEAQKRVVAYMTESNSDFCRDLRYICETRSTQCPRSPCDDADKYAKLKVELPSDPVVAIGAATSAVQAALVDTKDSDSATRLRTWASTTSQELQNGFRAGQGVTGDCSLLMTPLRTDIFNHMCGVPKPHGEKHHHHHHDDVRHLFGAVAGISGGLIALSFATILVLIFAMKRFRPLNSYNAEPRVGDEAAPINVEIQGDLVIGDIYRSTDAAKGTVVVKDVPMPPPRASYGTAEEDTHYSRV